MKLFLTQSANVGDAKAYLLHEVFRAAAQKANVSIVFLSPCFNYPKDLVQYYQIAQR